MKEIKTIFTRIKQPIGEIYSFNLTSQELRNIIKFDREDNPKKTKLIYDTFKYDITMPQNIVINLDFDNISVNCNEMIIKYKSAVIIDGLHRLLAIDMINPEMIIPVIAYVDMSPYSCFERYFIINKANQQRYNLLEFCRRTEIREPLKTANRIASVLNNNTYSCYKGMISEVGNVDTKTLNKSIVTRAIIKYISKDPISDMNKTLSGEKLEMYKPDIYIFRRYFIEDKDIDIIAHIVNYTNAYSEIYSDIHSRNFEEIMFDMSTLIVCYGLDYFKTKDDYLKILHNDN